MLVKLLNPDANVLIRHMMIGIITALGLLAVAAAWESCGLPSGCHCTAPIIHSIQCQNITVFPSFDDIIKPGVLTITISDSRVVGLPPFNETQWDRLERVTFLRTQMSCDAIEEVRRPGLDILSDCRPDERRPCATPAGDCRPCKCKTPASFPICLGVSLTLLFPMILAIVYIRIKWSKPEQNDVEEMQQN